MNNDGRYMWQNDNFTRNVVVDDNIGFNQGIEWAQ